MTYGYQYEKALADVLRGNKKSDRTGTGTTSLFGLQMRFDLTKGFPLVTTKKVHVKSVVQELLWMLSGSTNVKDLQAMGCSIWDEWARADGSLGPVYGRQWRSWPTVVRKPEGGAHYDHIDQISRVVIDLQLNPDSRRHVVSAWNVADLPDMALAPCHCLFQFYVQELTDNERVLLLRKKVGFGELLKTTTAATTMERHYAKYDIPSHRLSCQLYQRSADMFLGVPFNIASYALLTHMVAQQVNMEVGEFIWTGGDCHIYNNHRTQVETQLSREGFDYPTLVIKRKPDSIFDYHLEDFEFANYQHQPAIKGDVAV